MSSCAMLTHLLLAEPGRSQRVDPKEDAHCTTLQNDPPFQKQSHVQELNLGPVLFRFCDAGLTHLLLAEPGRSQRVDPKEGAHGPQETLVPKKGCLHLPLLIPHIAHHLRMSEAQL
jgi:hypothetical protein